MAQQVAHPSVGLAQGGWPGAEGNQPAELKGSQGLTLYADNGTDVLLSVFLMASCFTRSMIQMMRQEEQSPDIRSPTCGLTRTSVCNPALPGAGMALQTRRAKSRAPLSQEPEKGDASVIVPCHANM
jgi:hypothetical protein